MPYRAPLAEIRFAFDHLVEAGQLAQTPRFADATSDIVAAVLEEAGRLSTDILAPLNRVGDKHPARLENGVVRTAPGFAEGFAAIAEGGWVAVSADPNYGGMGLPLTVTTAINEMMGSACLSLHLNPLLTQGQIEALEHHASDAIKALYLPKLISGEWTGTMNLTEPQAGTDVGALRSKAERMADGSYAISGQKIFISWGDGDISANICHLVLARLPEGAAGTKGISLFLVPKFLPDAAGNLGARNCLSVVSLEHKLGLHAAPTAVMQYDGAKGWLIGEEHKGLAAMFTMMNNARLAVGVQGLSVAEAAYQQALGFAMERKQGMTPLGATAIIGHADVRRMLVTMRAQVCAARAIALACSVAIDMGNATGAADWQARGAFLTPIAKAYCTDIGNEVAQMALQVHGGMGVIEETGAAQFARDVRVTTIYEGTNGIQSMDLVGRKMMDQGAAAFALIDEMESGAEAARARYPDLATAVWNATETLREATEALIAQALQDRFAGSVAYLRAFALVLSGHYHLKAAMADAARAPLARVAIKRLMPEYAALLQQVAEGAAGLYEVTPEALGA